MRLSESRPHKHMHTQGVILTSWTFSLALMSDGCTSDPMTFKLPCTTMASSGRSVFMPTLPWWYTESGSWPRCHSTSLSFSNWPGLDAWRGDRRRRMHGQTDGRCSATPHTTRFGKQCFAVILKVPYYTKHLCE